MTILRTGTVTALTGLSRTTLWRLERVGQFPPRLRLGANSVGWRKDEVLDWIDERPRGLAAADQIQDELGQASRSARTKGAMVD